MVLPYVTLISGYAQGFIYQTRCVLWYFLKRLLLWAMLSCEARCALWYCLKKLLRWAMLKRSCEAGCGFHNRLEIHLFRAVLKLSRGTMWVMISPWTVLKDRQLPELNENLLKRQTWHDILRVLLVYSLLTPLGLHSRFGDKLLGI